VPLGFGFRVDLVPSLLGAPVMIRARLPVTCMVHACTLASCSRAHRACQTREHPACACAIVLVSVACVVLVSLACMVLVSVA
jgi:hypothetical protein